MSEIYEKLKDHYKMLPHPEGGHFVETYRSSIEISAPQGKRNPSTAIHFLLKAGDRSHLHRLKSDEGWHYHLGDPLRLVEITPTGEVIETIIGPNFEKGEVLQHFVPAGHWFGSETTGEFSFVGCTVAPGFEFSDFEMAKKESFAREFPHLSAEILSFVLD